VGAKSLLHVARQRGWCRGAGAHAILLEKLSGVYSKTFYTRNIRGWFADPEMPDLRLKQLYPHTNEAWSKRYTWPLWRDAEPEDRYVFKQVHVCLDENQTEFDHQNALLAKLVIDSLNVAEITRELKMERPPDGALSRLELLLTSMGFTETKQQLRPLRIIQNLRSAGAVHAKGEEYAVAIKRGGLEKRSLVDASMKVFQGAVDFVEWVRNKVLEIEDEGLHHSIRNIRSVVRAGPIRQNPLVQKVQLP
jgi:hypothetical protein